MQYTKAQHFRGRRARDRSARGPVGGAPSTGGGCEAAAFFRRV